VESVCFALLSLRTISQGVLLINSLKIWKLGFLKSRVLIILCLSYIPQECELHQCVIIAVQAASSLHITDKPTCIGDHQVQYYIVSSRAASDAPVM